ncbi:MAG: penicillin-binding protein activator [Hyphomonadaceae bacterium]|nr:penicillin-binding protein activator [Hyphomonadaceae bacterium]
MNALSMAYFCNILQLTGTIKALSVMGIAAFFTACTTTPTPQEPIRDPAVGRPVPQTMQPQQRAGPTPDIREQNRTETDKSELRRNGLTPPHMTGRDIKRLALLLPFSSERWREEADSMLDAAEMAVFDRDEADVLLIALDTGGTETGAARATRAALTLGADVILGPVLARSAIGASREARDDGTPVIAFSTDQTVAGNGTYLLSFPPEAEVERIVEFAARTGVRNFAFLGPEDTYGQRVEEAYNRSVQRVGGQVTHRESYDGSDISVMQTPAQAIADAYKRHVRDAEPTARAAYEAILLPEGGTELRSLAPLLPFYDIDPADVQFLGTSRWYREDTGREPALNGGIFAGPDAEARDLFRARYDSRFGREVGSLASLAYDAVNIGASIASEPRSDRHARAQDPQGFFGVDGFIQFDRDGTARRGLAVYQIRNGKFVIIDPAPKSAGGPS